MRVPPTSIFGHHLVLEGSRVGFLGGHYHRKIKPWIDGKVCGRYANSLKD